MRTTRGRPKITVKELQRRAKRYGDPALVGGSAEYYRMYRARQRLRALEGN